MNLLLTALSFILRPLPVPETAGPRPARPVRRHRPRPARKNPVPGWIRRNAAPNGIGPTRKLVR
jgi:hypothetical protein